MEEPVEPIPVPAVLRVLLVEDHPAVRHGLRLLLENASIEICSEAENTEEALRALETLKPGLVLLDLSLGEESGLDLMRRLIQVRPGLPILVYSMFEDATHVALALKAGARAYVAKREPMHLLIEAIRACLQGKRYLSPRVEEKLAAVESEALPQELLSAQEQQVFELLGEGLATPAIAARLDLSPRTVQSYYTRILQKLALPGMKELRQKAIAQRV